MPKFEGRICETCGRIFTAEVKPSRPTWGRFCSRTCRNSGKANPNWRGGIQQHPKGYVYRWAPDHPQADALGRVLEHRLVAEMVLGRPLQPDEDVHHRNGIKGDNRPENLEVIDHGNHSRIHVCRLKRSPRGWWLTSEQVAAMPVQLALDLPEWMDVLEEC